MDELGFIESLLCCCILFSDEPEERNYKRKIDNSCNSKDFSSSITSTIPVTYGTLINDNDHIKRQ